MSDEVTRELSFTSDVVAWINAIIEQRGTLPFSRASIEKSSSKSRRPRDVTLYDLDGKPVLTGEVKLPFRADGRSPYNWALVDNAARKAVEAGVPYFFTWNVNTFVLWMTLKKGVPLIHRDQEKYDVAEVAEEGDLGDPALARRISAFFDKFLERYAQLAAGDKPLMTRSLDERFIDILDAALQKPSFLIRSATWNRYRADASFRKRLNRWMTAQGMAIADAEMTDNIARTAKISAYVMASKLMFYKALHRRFRLDLRRLSIPDTVETAQQLRMRLSKYFLDAQKATGDYETVFEEDEIDDLPFLTDAMVPAWRGLIQDLDGFDFTEMDYDLLGPIFERMISPRERHRWGQHYTKPEVCDIINAFVIRTPSDRVLDPACGGGTFLVRAYARKRHLAREQSLGVTHQELLSEISGIDISPYAAHIATVNLASRRLADEENYPQVRARDFFHAGPKTPIVHVPTAERPASRRRRTPDRPMPNVSAGFVNAIVGNPPYIRQEKLGDDYKKMLATKARTSSVPMDAVPGRSDIHIYFWPHAASFLVDGGRIGLLTSSNWLDTEYGFALQKWILANFRILAILESAAEPWFTGARVATAVTILEREPDHRARCENKVKFLQLRRPLSELLPSEESEDERLRQTQEFVTRILAAGDNLSTTDYRLRIVLQGGLLLQGIEPMSLPHAEVADPVERWPLERYRGSKWGPFLRAPDFFFEVVDRFRERLVPLACVAQISRGVTTGADEFFCVYDVTEEELAKNQGAFRHRFGIKAGETAAVRLVRAGDGSLHPVEARYLVPEIHRLAEADSVELRSDGLPRRLLLVSEPLPALRGTRVAAYIRWGQMSPRRYHMRSTCRSRDPWYDLTGQRPGTILWSMSHKYRHLALWNADRVICNHNLFNVTARPPTADETLCAVLNSTLAGWIKCYYGRPMGTEGYKTEVVDVNMMLVPDPRSATPGVAKRLAAALESMRKRQAHALTAELDFEDRQALDDAVFELLGVTSAAERRRLREKLYEETRRFYRSLRHVEVQATRNRTRTARRAKVTPHDIALEIWDRLDKSTLRRFPDSFLHKGASVAMEAIVLPPQVPDVEVGRDLFTTEPDSCTAKKRNHSFAAGLARAGDHVLDLGSQERAEYLAALVTAGKSDTVLVPLDKEVCASALRDFAIYRNGLISRLQQEAESHVGDSQLARQVAIELERICLRGPVDLVSPVEVREPDQEEVPEND